MSQELEELKGRIKAKLLDAGFKDITPEHIDCQRTFALGNEYHHEPCEGYSFKWLEGYQLYFEEVYRSNGTNQNISIRIYAMEWHRSSGRAFHMVKVSYKDSHKKQDRLIDEIITAYKEKISEVQANA